MSIYLAVFGKPRYLGLVDISEPAPKSGVWIVMKTVRGLEMGLLGGPLSQEQEARYRAACLEDPGDEQTRGPEPMLQEVEYVGEAQEEQIQDYYSNREGEEGVLIRSRQLLKEHSLQMKLIDVEYTMDRKKLFFYFTSEQRIDFRAYVRDLAKEFRIRIEMRQIGVRDEAKTVRGISPCGRPCCCSYWLHRFTPICIRMVKEQNLALNPTKISGICGRLMCCMAYEHPLYSDLWKSLPSPGSKIKTPQGNYILDGIDLRSESIKIRFPQGNEVAVPIAEFADFRDTVLQGGNWEVEKTASEDSRRLPSYPKKPSPAGASSKNTQAEPMNKTDSLKAGKKFKPEKISLEAHIAGRIKNNEPEGEAKEPAGKDLGPKKTRRKKNERPTAQSSSKELQEPRKDRQQRPAQKAAEVPKENQHGSLESKDSGTSNEKQGQGRFRPRRRPGGESRGTALDLGRNDPTPKGEGSPHS